DGRVPRTPTPTSTSSVPRSSTVFWGGPFLGSLGSTCFVATMHMRWSSSPSCGSRRWEGCERLPDPTTRLRWYRLLRGRCSHDLTLGLLTMRFRSDAPHERVMRDVWAA